MRAAVFSLGLLLLATNAFAHRLDEYLQAARIAVTTNRVELPFDLTPGVAVAARVLALIDQDHDGTLSEPEVRAYARLLLKDIRVELDGKQVALNLTGAAAPTASEIRGGVGVIRVKVSSSVGPLDAGSHVLHLTNGHLPALSVYLVNALRPRDAAVEIDRQSRDQRQQDYRLEFSVKPAGP